MDQLHLINAIKAAPSKVADLIDVSEIPNFTIFGKIDILTSPQETFGWLLLIPVFAGITSYFTMWLSRRFSGTAQMMGGADAQKSNIIMDLIMPLISAYMSYIFPATLGLYWAYQSIFGIGQTLILSKVMPLPKFTEEDMKRAEKEMKVDEVKRKPTKVRSLHHIDDDEEDEAVARATGSSKRYGDDEDDAPKAAPANGKIAPAAMKNYDNPKKKNKKEAQPEIEAPSEEMTEQTEEKQENQE
jgi:YidC/Oxa1 family membrane protein insertase